jgi:tetratricopeptide (TPR) repeat protein
MMTTAPSAVPFHISRRQFLRTSTATLALSTLGLALFAAICTGAEALDFGDRSAATITGKAWAALDSQSYEDAIGYAKKCVELYEKQAVEMQKELKEPVPDTDKEAVLKKWALNDVGTCYFIMGQALEQQKKREEAMAAYKQVVEKLPFAQCWDPQGWFWKPADAAKDRVKALEFAAPK